MGNWPAGCGGLSTFSCREGAAAGRGQLRGSSTRPAPCAPPRRRGAPGWPALNHRRGKKQSLSGTRTETNEPAQKFCRVKASSAVGGRNNRRLILGLWLRLPRCAVCSPHQLPALCRAVRTSECVDVGAGSSQNPPREPGILEEEAPFQDGDREGWGAGRLAVQKVSRYQTQTWGLVGDTGACLRGSHWTSSK